MMMSRVVKSGEEDGGDEGKRALTKMMVMSGEKM